ncbi:unnamed protein product, partial [Scytosiphon promiscuus]
SIGDERCSRADPPPTPASCQARDSFPPHHVEVSESLAAVAAASCPGAVREGGSTAPAPSAGDQTNVRDATVPGDTPASDGGGRGSLSGEGVELLEIALPRGRSGDGGGTGDVQPAGSTPSTTPPRPPSHATGVVGEEGQPDGVGGRDADAAAAAAAAAVSRIDGRGKNGMNSSGVTNSGGGGNGNGGSSGSSSVSDGRVRVLCRFRRHSDRRREGAPTPGTGDWLNFGDGGGGGGGGGARGTHEGSEGAPPDTVSVRMGGGWSTRGFDKVFKPGVEQVEVYEEVKHVAHGVSQGFNGTIFAYGQTGSGKTYTMGGSTDKLSFARAPASASDAPSPMPLSIVAPGLEHTTPPPTGDGPAAPGPPTPAGDTDAATPAVAAAAPDVSPFSTASSAACPPGAPSPIALPEASPNVSAPPTPSLSPA